MIIEVLTAVLLQAPPVVLENEHVRVTRNRSSCLMGLDGCGQRVLVALDEIEVARAAGVEREKRDVIGGIVGPRQRLRRGNVVVFGPGERYLEPTGDFLEVTIRANRPPVKSPTVQIPPDKNSILYDGDDFFIFEEKLDPGDTRARHSHRERVVIVINKTRLQQWPDGSPEIFRDQVPDDVRFNPPVVHVVKTVGELPLRNIVIEFKR